MANRDSGMGEATKTTSRQTDIMGIDGRTDRKGVRIHEKAKVLGDRRREGWKCPIIQTLSRDLPVCWDAGSYLASALLLFQAQC